MLESWTYRVLEICRDGNETTFPAKHRSLAIGKWINNQIYRGRGSNRAVIIKAAWSSTLVFGQSRYHTATRYVIVMDNASKLQVLTKWALRCNLHYCSPWTKATKKQKIWLPQNEPWWLPTGWPIGKCNGDTRNGCHMPKHKIWLLCFTTLDQVISLV